LFAADVVIAGTPAADRLPAELAANGLLQELIANCTGWSPAGDSDWSLDEATLDRLAVSGTPGEREPHFVIQIGELWSTTAVWAWRKSDVTQPEGWAKLKRRLGTYIAGENGAPRQRGWLGRARRQS